MSIARRELRPGTGGPRSVRPGLARGLAHLVAMTLTCALVVGCAGRTAPQRSRSGPRVVSLESRIDAVPGRTLVIPIDPEGPIDPARPISGRLDDGSVVDAGVYWISVAPDDGPPPIWLAPAGKWAATPAGANTRPAGRGQWALVVELPPAAAGQGLWIGAERLPLNWLPDPASMSTPTGPIEWRSPVPESQRTSVMLQHLADPERLSPLRRWRYHLLMRGLAPKADAVGDPDEFADPVIEALAAQLEGRWQVALALLREANAELAERVKRRLAAVVDLGDGISAPAWPPVGPDVDQLLRALLHPGIEPAERAARAEAWLVTQPPAVAWVADDAGARDGVTGASLGSIGIANLSDRATLAWATSEMRRTAPELVPVGAMEAGRIVVQSELPGEPGDARSSRPTPVRANAGRWSTPCAVLPDRIPVTPPGLRLDPLLRDRTLDQWLAGPGVGTDPEDGAWATAILLHQPGSTVAPPPLPSPAGAVVHAESREPGSQLPLWWIYGECRAPAPADGVASDEVVRIWLGPMGRPLSVIRVSSSGAITDEGAQRAGDAFVGARVVREPDRWVFQIPVPDRCAEPDGVLRIGVERTDARGVRRAWPRPMLPWQSEPGRAAVSLAHWRSLTPSSAAR